MAVAIQMIHDVDPREEIYAGLPKGWEKIKVIGTEVLVAHYVRPGKTKGGILLAENQGIRPEEKYQGKAALVLKVGPKAFAKDDTHDWGEDVPKVGDWIAVWGSDAPHSLELGERRCRLVEDVHIKMVIPQPDIIY